MFNKIYQNLKSKPSNKVSNPALNANYAFVLKQNCMNVNKSAVHICIIHQECDEKAD